MLQLMQSMINASGRNRETNRRLDVTRNLYSVHQMHQMEESQTTCQKRRKSANVKVFTKYTMHVDIYHCISIFSKYCWGMFQLITVILQHRMDLHTMVLDVKKQAIAYLFQIPRQIAKQIKTLFLYYSPRNNKRRKHIKRIVYIWNTMTQF